MNTILFYLAHPAQFLFAKATILELLSAGKNIHLFIKKKDVLEELVKAEGMNYVCIQESKKSNSKTGLILSMLKRDWKLISFMKENPVDILIGTDASVAHAGRIFGKKVITVLEDDFDIIKHLAKVTYPFTNHILVPNVCDVGKYKQKKIGYPGYMKLAYLAPGRFVPNRSKVEQSEVPYFLLRLSALQAHHDVGVKGLSDSILRNIIRELEKSGRVYISSEKKLKKEFEPYRLHLHPSDIHHYMYYSEMFISDSQSMSVEAALLGVPSIRYSDFAGRISVLNELENTYNLTYGIKPKDTELLFKIIDKLLNMDDRRGVFQLRRKNMLSEKIDVSAFLTWFLQHYPQSVQVLRDNRDYYDRFKFTEEQLNRIDD